MSQPTPATRPLVQVALSVADLARSQRWYRDVFGLVEAGGSVLFRDVFGMAKAVGLPGTDTEAWWLLDSQDSFQLELWQYRRPEPVPLPGDWRPCDTGYTTIGLHVADFDATLARLARRQVPLAGPPLGPPGARRVCVRDPDGILLELLEDDPRGTPRRRRPRDCPTTTRFVTLSVPDLDVARRVWVDALGIREPSATTLHGRQHEALWGMPGARSERLVLDAGDLFVELVHYAEPVGRPWPPAHRISDLGILNVALGVRSNAEHDALVTRCAAVGAHPHSTRPTLLKPLWYARYYLDPLGFSIELLYHARPSRRAPVNPFGFVELGFVPRTPPVRRASVTAYTAASPATVWGLLTRGDRAPAVERGRGERRRPRELWRGSNLRLVALEPPERLEYVVRGPVGVRRHHGVVMLDGAPGGGTTIRWDLQWRSPLPGVGTAIVAGVRRQTRDLARTADLATFRPVGA